MTLTLADTDMARSTPVQAMQRDMRRYLATQTADLHESLHSHTLFTITGSAGNTKQKCLDFHKVFWRYYYGLEAAMRSFPELTQFSLVKEYALISSEYGEIDLPDCTPRLRSFEEALGALYVAHGTAFGRSSLAQLVRDSGNSASLFLQKKPDANLWRQLLSVLDQAGETAENRRDCLSGAIKSFEYFEECADRMCR
jgi:heme oxygenase